jgi:hypothetical protein
MDRSLHGGTASVNGLEQLIRSEIPESTVMSLNVEYRTIHATMMHYGAVVKIVVCEIIINHMFGYQALRLNST